MFNLWRRYPKRKPKENGVYLCKERSLEGTIHITDLYFDDIDGGIWIDTRRQSVFNGYKVYKPGRATIEENRVFEDCLCVRDNIIAWKKLPTVRGQRKEK